MTEQEKAILAAIVESGITPEALVALLSRASILTAVEGARAEWTRKRTEAAAAAAAFELEIQALQEKLTELETQAATIL